MKKIMIYISATFLFVFLTASPAYASHSESHLHYFGTTLNTQSVTHYCSGTTLVEKVWLVDRDWYKVYSHNYVLFDLWYNHSDTYSSIVYLDYNKRLQGTYYYPNAC